MFASNIYIKRGPTMICTVIHTTMTLSNAKDNIYSVIIFL